MQSSITCSIVDIAQLLWLRVHVTRDYGWISIQSQPASFKLFDLDLPTQIQSQEWEDSHVDSSQGPTVDTVLSIACIHSTVACFCLDVWPQRPRFKQRLMAPACHVQDTKRCRFLPGLGSDSLDIRLVSHLVQDHSKAGYAKHCLIAH